MYIDRLFLYKLSALTIFKLSNGFLTYEIPKVVRTPDSKFSSLSKLGYPWEPNYFDVNLPSYPILRMHYLDLGPSTSTETLLFLHGTPTWSYEFRKVFPLLLEKGYRIIAPDFIGFGKSDKLTSLDDYTHQLHTDSLLQLVKHLDLQGVTLFGHDLGGPTGLSVVRREKSRFNRLVLFNTWAPQGDIFTSFDFTRQHLPFLAFRTATLVLKRHVPVKLICATASRATPKELEGYTAPFPNSLYKAGPGKWPLLVPLFGTEPMAVEMQQVKQFLQNDWAGPVMYGFSDKEVFTTPGGALFSQLFATNGCQRTVTNAKHLLTEDEGPQVAKLIINFIENGC